MFLNKLENFSLELKFVYKSRIATKEFERRQEEFKRMLLHSTILCFYDTYKIFIGVEEEKRK